MKSTKYQLLEDDFNSAIRDLKMYREVIEELREENKRYKKALELIYTKSNELNFAKDIARKSISKD